MTPPTNAEPRPLSREEMARLEIQARMRELSLVPACESIGRLLATIAARDVEIEKLRKGIQHYIDNQWDCSLDDLRILLAKELFS